MLPILSEYWAKHTSSQVAIVSNDEKFQWLADILNNAVTEELHHARRREHEPRLDSASYDKSYSRTYTEYTRDNPMYDIPDYTAYLP